MRRTYDIWDDSVGAVVKVEALSFDDAIEEHARELIDEGHMSDRFDVVARDEAGEWVQVRVSWEHCIEVSLGRAQPCRDPRGEEGE